MIDLGIRLHADTYIGSQTGLWHVVVTDTWTHKIVFRTGPHGSKDDAIKALEYWQQKYSRKDT